MNIVITHAFSLEQKGDSALLAGTIAQLHQTFPHAHLSAHIMAHTKADQTYKLTPVLESVIFTATVPDINKFARLGRMAYVLGITLTWALLARVTGKSYRLGMSGPLYASCNSIFKADAVVPVAGGYLAGGPSIGESLNMVFVVLPLWLAHIIRCPVVHFSQSIGPLSNGFQRWLVAGPLKRAKLVITRESTSTAYARTLGVAESRLMQSVDAGFLFEPEAGYQLASALEDAGRRNPAKPVVGITSKQHLTAAPQRRYEQEMAAFADWLCAERGMQVVFIPQVTSPELDEDDRVINRRLYELLNRKQDAFLIEQNLTNHQTKSVIDHMDYVVGTRFHSVIFALTGLVPSIGLEYEHKTSGILRDLDLSHWTLKMADMRSPQLEALFDELVAGRAAYITQLKTALPGYVGRADEARERMRKALS